MPRNTRASRPIDAVLLTLCVVSLACYVVFSESVRAFAAEAVRLAGKL